MTYFCIMVTFSTNKMDTYYSIDAKWLRILNRENNFIACFFVHNEILTRYHAFVAAPIGANNIKPSRTSQYIVHMYGQSM